MADLGDIAGGIIQGLNQGIRTIADVQRINLLKDAEEREKNKYKVWEAEEIRKATPIYTNRLKEKYDPEVYDVGYKRALAAGVVNYPGDQELEHIPQGRFEEFLKGQDPKNPDYQMARFNAATRKVDEAQSQFDKITDPEKKVQAQASLDKLKQTADNEKWGVQSLVERQKIENEKKALPTMDQVIAHEYQTLMAKAATLESLGGIPEKVKELRDQAARIRMSLKDKEKFQEKGVTEKGGDTVSYDPSNAKNFVTKPDGTRESYDPKIHGKILGTALSQTTVINTTERAKFDKQAIKIGDAIISGKQPPVVSGFGMSKIAPQVKAYLADKDFDLTTAEQDYNATKKYLSSLNSTQQVRLKQATTFAYDSLDIIEKLGKEWDGGKFAPLNWVNLQAAKNGVYGKQAAIISTKLDAQIADLTSELGTVYKGGNSSTDESLKLAAENLKSKWDYDVLVSNINQIRQNLQIRKNSMKFTGATRMGPAGLLPEQPLSAPTQKVIRYDSKGNRI